MPRMDGTGPRGASPRTGRGLGNCKNFDNNNLNKEELKNTLQKEKELIENKLKELESNK